MVLNMVCFVLVCGFCAGFALLLAFVVCVLVRCCRICGGRDRVGVEFALELVVSGRLMGLIWLLLRA